MLPTDQPTTATEEMEPGRDLAPEEKQMHDHLYGLASVMLYDEGYAPKAAQMIEAAPNPVQGVANLASGLMTKILRSAENAGERIPGASAMTAAISIMTELRDFADQMLDVQLSDDQFKMAFYAAMDQVSDMIQSMDIIDIDPNDLAQLEQMVDPAAAQEEVAMARQGVMRGEQPITGQPPQQRTGVGERP